MRPRALARFVLQLCLVAAGVWLAAPASDACDAMPASEYRDPPEWVDLELDRGAWDLGVRWRSEAYARKEYVPSAQTLHDWTQLVVWNANLTPKRPDLAAAQEDFLRTMRSACPSLGSQQLLASESERIFEWWHEGCNGRPAQQEIVRILAGKLGQHTISYSRRGAFPDEERQRWREWIARAPVRQRIPMEGKLSAFDRAQVAVWTGDYARAVELLRPLAKGGDASAQELFARLHVEGWGVPRDYALAHQWFEKALAKSPAAAYNLGRLYEQGWGVAQDGARALSLFRQAGEQGNEEAAGRVGYLLATASGERDLAGAYAWFERALAGGHGHAQLWLGKLLAEGARGEPDMAQVRSFYEQAAREGEPEAQYELGALCAKKAAGPCEDREAIKWLTRAAMQGNDKARQFYADHYTGKTSAAR
jgi:TPR repeat protein